MEQDTGAQHGGGQGTDSLERPAGSHGVPLRPHPVVAGHDRWAWRRRIRADPRKYRVYRIVVAVVGGTMVLLGLSTGWLPGPGGIPLVLLGLAVLASEFTWAHRLLQWARVKVREASEWAAKLPWWVRGLGTLATIAALVAVGWLALAIFGLPSWVPGQATTVLTEIPGVR